MKTIKLFHRGIEIGEFSVNDSVDISYCSIKMVEHLDSEGFVSFRLKSDRYITMCKSTFYNLLIDLRNSGKNIDAIKLYREYEENLSSSHQSNLKDAKEFVENLKFDSTEKKFFVDKE